ncbi:MAG TPA: hypothetical protein VHZ32_11325, partial [Rhizomicrobium sp.]|nr:hypothetical protein [Rhizomicrobium sp.]
MPNKLSQTPCQKVRVIFRCVRGFSGGRGAAAFAEPAANARTNMQQPWLVAGGKSGKAGRKAVVRGLLHRLTDHLRDFPWLRRLPEFR